MPYKDPAKAAEYHRKWMQEYRANHPDYNAYARDYYNGSPRTKQLVRQRNIRRKALIADVSVGDVDLAKLISEWNRLCGICGEFVYGAFDVDHIIPVSRGGLHTQSNLQLTHSRCNRIKGAR